MKWGRTIDGTAGVSVSLVAAGKKTEESSLSLLVWSAGIVFVYLAVCQMRSRRPPTPMPRDNTSLLHPGWFNLTSNAIAIKVGTV